MVRKIPLWRPRKSNVMASRTLRLPSPLTWTVTAKRSMAKARDWAAAPGASPRTARRQTRSRAIPQLPKETRGTCRSSGRSSSKYSRLEKRKNDATTFEGKLSMAVFRSRTTALK